jgi:chromate reductase
MLIRKERKIDMGEVIRIGGIAGSLRKGSFNRAALRAAVGLLPTDTVLDIFDLDGIPGFNEDDEPSFPSAARSFKEKVKAADAILIVTPEYNYSVLGVLKNAIDWASRPYGESAWSGKPVAIMGASPGMLGTARAQYHLRQSFVFLNMFPLNQPEVMIANAADKFDEHGTLKDVETAQKIKKPLEALVDWTRRLRRPRVDRCGAEGNPYSSQGLRQAENPVSKGVTTS